jgi:hypothetical protein
MLVPASRCCFRRRCRAWACAGFVIGCALWTTRSSVAPWRALRPVRVLRIDAAAGTLQTFLALSAVTAGTLAWRRDSRVGSGGIAAGLATLTHASHRWRWDWLHLWLDGRAAGSLYAGGLALALTPP